MTLIDNNGNQLGLDATNAFLNELTLAYKVLLFNNFSYICTSILIINTKMKANIHPSTYRKVVFKDMSNDYMFLSGSCANSKETIKWEDGNEYPVIKLEISNTSHPFFTGQNILVDTAGRIDKFKKKYAKK